MPRIHWIEDEDASGPLAEIYNGWKAANPGRDRFPDVMKCFSTNPEFLSGVMQMSYGLHFVDGRLTRRQKESIATYVSALNSCRY